MDTLFGSDSEAEEEILEPAQAVPASADAAAAPAPAAEDNRMEDLFGDSDGEGDADDKGDEEEIEFDDGGEEIRGGASTQRRAVVPRGAPPRAAEPSRAEPDVPRKRDEFTCADFQKPASTATASIVRVPKFIEFAEAPYDERTYAEELSKQVKEDEVTDAAQMVRWRYVLDADGAPVLGADGAPMRESNARLVKWSNGTTQLLVGDERFDVVERALTSTYLFLQSKPRGASMCLFGHAKLDAELRLRPTNLSSDAHKAFTLQARKASIKTARIKEVYSMEDPEAAKRERVRQRDDELRKASRRRTKAPRRGGQQNEPMASMDDKFLEYDDSSLAKAKSDSRNAPKAKKKAASLFGDDEDEAEDDDDDDDDKWAAGKRRDDKKAKAKKDRIEEEEEEEDDDDDAPAPASKRRRKVAADDDDDDE
ncbi:Leo1-like protein-domain-containing protein [Pelagophyceae sp. CCMP2097]|nr:Leo1-like protein-domain-containing protein [Pelagophyceae sp. CCMP2097]|mmetsp:Transcript_10955/g.38696  ORF Transcript_10955/g.38696 Transcript_10955/m.38696 type:complete len:424 (+) Transcript_10955:46-1317(+)